jgi:hypothetical protein
MTGAIQTKLGLETTTKITEAIQTKLSPEMVIEIIAVMLKKSSLEMIKKVTAGRAIDMVKVTKTGTIMVIARTIIRLATTIKTDLSKIVR